jgi:hypothetical protein
MAAQARTVSPVSGKVWTGRVLSTLVVLFLLFDVFGKYTRPAPVVQAFAQMHIPLADAPIIGTLALICTILYVIPRTAPLGVVLLTGYLGGAMATSFFTGQPVFSILFPVIFAVIAWAGLGLRDRRAMVLLAAES